MVPSRSSRATATVRASRMLWAEGIRVAVLNSGFGCMVNARGPEPRDPNLGETSWSGVNAPVWERFRVIPARRRREFCRRLFRSAVRVAEVDRHASLDL